MTTPCEDYPCREWEQPMNDLVIKPVPELRSLELWRDGRRIGVVRDYLAGTEPTIHIIWYERSKFLGTYFTLIEIGIVLLEWHKMTSLE